MLVGTSQGEDSSCHSAAGFGGQVHINPKAFIIWCSFAHYRKIVFLNVCNYWKLHVLLSEELLFPWTAVILQVQPKGNTRTCPL